MITPVTSKVDLLATADRRRNQTDALPTSAQVAEHTHGSDFIPASPAHRVALEQAVGKVREVLQQSGSQLQMEVDQDLQMVVVKILKGDSGEVIRQIPPQEMIELAKNLAGLKGLLFEEQV